MKGNMTVILGIVIALALFLTPAHAKQNAISFAGDVVITTPDSTVKAKLYVKNPYVRRLEMSREAGGMVFITPENARGRVWMLDPSKKQYRILSWPEVHKDPISAWTDIQYDMAGSRVGNETIKGHPCTVYEYKYRGKDAVALKLWLAEDIHFAIKRKADAKIAVEKNKAPQTIRGTLQVLNIEKGELDDALFKIPTEYKEIK